jgi:hypothetical protein
MLSALPRKGISHYISGMEKYQILLARLTTDFPFRSRFLNLKPEDLPSFGAESGLSEAEMPALQDLYQVRNEMAKFATSLWHKRFEEMLPLVPALPRLFGEKKLRQIFLTYARETNYNPQGIRKIARDARHFTSWLETKPETEVPTDWKVIISWEFCRVTNALILSSRKRWVCWQRSFDFHPLPAILWLERQSSGNAGLDPQEQTLPAEFRRSGPKRAIFWKNPFKQESEIRVSWF